MSAARPAVFIDKDGTLVEDVPYNADPEKLRFVPRAFDALRLLAGHGYALVVVTNQSGLALGRFDTAAWLRMRDAIAAACADAGAPLAGITWCPHAPGADGRPQCDCRKPEPGLLIDAAGRLQLDLGRSWMVGDILDDVEAGCRAGCRSVLLDVGHETVWAAGPCRVPDVRVPSFWDAACHIVGQPDVATPAQSAEAASTA